MNLVDFKELVLENQMKWDPNETYPEGYEKYMGADGFWDRQGRFSGAFDDGVGSMLSKKEVDELVERDNSKEE